MRTTTLDLVFLTSLTAGLVYFSVDAWLGESGGAKIGPLKREINALEREVDALAERRSDLQRRNTALSGEIVDGDLLDERLRAVIGVANPHDVLILDPPLE